MAGDELTPISNPDHLRAARNRLEFEWCQFRGDWPKFVRTKRRSGTPEEKQAIQSFDGPPTAIPGGITERFRNLGTTLTIQAMQKLTDLAFNKEGNVSPTVQLQAINSLLNRTDGKPISRIHYSDENTIRDKQDHLDKLIAQESTVREILEKRNGGPEPGATPNGRTPETTQRTEETDPGEAIPGAS